MTSIDSRQAEHGNDPCSHQVERGTDPCSTNVYLRYYRDEMIKQSLGWLSPREYREALGYAV